MHFELRWESKEDYTKVGKNKEGGLNYRIIKLHAFLRVVSLAVSEERHFKSLLT